MSTVAEIKANLETVFPIPLTIIPLTLDFSGKTVDHVSSSEWVMLTDCKERKRKAPFPLTLLFRSHYPLSIQPSAFSHSSRPLFSEPSQIISCLIIILIFTALLMGAGRRWPLWRRS